MAHIKPEPIEARTLGEVSRQATGKLRYVRMDFHLEIADESYSGRIESIKPEFMDAFLNLVGKKTYQELSSVQGRYLLRNETLELANDLLKENIVTNVLFSSFVVQ